MSEMLEFITINLFRIIYCVMGAYFIGCALVRLEKKHYFMVGMEIMLAVWSAVLLLSTFA